MNVTAHKFESAGLGPAPYTFLRVEEKRGPISLGGGVTVGAPGQPMSCCDYCATGIAMEFWLRAADGREFKVGSDCINKAGDASLKKTIDPIVKAHRKALADARAKKQAAAAKERISAAKTALENPKTAAALAALPHPYQWLADQGRSALDFVEWMLVNAGQTGKLKAARMIEAAAGSPA